MQYCGTNNTEMIWFNAMDGCCDNHYIELIKLADEPVLCVRFCCDPEWYYEFVLEDNTVYERIKYNIMEAIFNYETIPELLDYLDDVFVDGFSDVLLTDDDDDDDYGCCGMCRCGNILN